MSESNSRYSIIERLADKKLEIMDELANIDIQPDKKRQEILELETLKESMLEELKDQLKEKEEYYNKRLTTVKHEIEMLEKTKEKRKANMELKLKEIDNALKTLGDVSRASVSQEQV
jgi:molecular chaperone DnaK (HSP70)